MRFYMHMHGIRDRRKKNRTLFGVLGLQMNPELIIAVEKSPAPLAENFSCGNIAGLR